MRKCAKILPYMRIPLVIYDLQPIPSEFPYVWGKFGFLFYQCTDSKLLDLQKNTSISRHNPFNRRLHVHCKAILSPCRRWGGPGEWGAGTGFRRRSSPRKESSRSRRYLAPSSHRNEISSIAQSTYVCREQSCVCVFHPHHHLHPASVSSPRTKGGGTHSPVGEGGGGSIFWKTPDIRLASYTIISLRSIVIKPNFFRGLICFTCSIIYFPELELLCWDC